MSKVKRFANLTDVTLIQEDENGIFTVGSQDSEPIEITEKAAEKWIDEVKAEWVSYKDAEDTTDAQK